MRFIKNTIIPNKLKNAWDRMEESRIKSFVTDNKSTTEFFMLISPYLLNLTNLDSISATNWKLASTHASASTSSATPGGSYKRNLGYTSYVETEIWENEKAGLVTVTGNVQKIMRESITRARVYAT
uniref:Uncharacterized protein n=2 Tax=Meloidogyne floridensis TaxID=298350 RepID=A0A915NJ53_9BILA